MSVNVGQLFVQHDNLSMLLKVATEYVRAWQRDIFSKLSELEKHEQGAENFLTRRTRRLTILPPRDSWAMIIEHVRFLADGDLARHISESLGCRVVWAEVQGGALGWACFEFDKGKLVGGKLEPVSGREQRLVAAANESRAANLSETEDGQMPLYPIDAEQEAWDHLVGLGIPPGYVFVYPGDVVRLNSGGDMEAGYIILKDSHYGGRMITASGPAKFLPRPEGLPYRPDLVARENGQPTAIHEVRLLHGRPSRGAVDRIFEAELAWRRRAFAIMSETLSGLVPPITFRYKDPAAPERDLDKQVEVRRTACRDSALQLTSGAQVLARKGFAARAAEIAAGEEPGVVAEPDEAGNLTLKKGDAAATTLDLREAYDLYIEQPAALEQIVDDALQAAGAVSSG